MNQIRWMRLLLFISIAIILAGCGSRPGADTPAPTSLPTPPNPVLPTPTLAARQPLLVETFDAPVHNWNVTQTNGDPALFRIEVVNGHWSFQLDGAFTYIYAIYQPVNYRSVRLDVQVANRGANQNFTTLVCHFDVEKGWYEFNLSNESDYHILYAQWDGENQQVLYTPLAEGTSTLIHPSENTFSAVCADNSLTLLVNGEQVHSLVEDQFGLNSGKVGIGVSSFDVLPVLMEFDSVTIVAP